MAQTDTAATAKVELVPIFDLKPLVLYEFRVERSKPVDRGVNVLLIHGLTGDPTKTWGDWPKQLASQLSERATLWTLGYPAPLFEIQLGTTREEFSTEGRNALKLLVEAKLGEKPIVFVTHSLGGLLAKEIIAEAAGTESDSKEYSIFANTHAVIFAGTPHAGSGQAKWRLLVPTVVDYAAKGATALIATGVLAWLSAIPFLSVTLFGRTWQATLGGIIAAIVALILAVALKSLAQPGRHVVMLDPSNPALASLTRKFRQAQFKRKFAVDSFYEMKRLWGLFLVVPRWSADPGITDSDPRGIPADHLQICKQPHAEALQRAIQKQVADASRGKDTSVFRERLALLLKQPEERDAFEILFAGKAGARGNAEEAFRTFLRAAIAKGAFVPTGPDLDLVMSSRFAEDILVWSLWHELKLADALRRLREYASWEVQKDFSSTQSADGRTLVPFYRVLRTIEHTLSGDLSCPGYGNKCDRDLLLRTVGEASEKLRKLAAAGLDNDGRTRRLILRLGSLVRMATTAKKFVGEGRYQEEGEQLAAILDRQQRVS